MTQDDQSSIELYLANLEAIAQEIQRQRPTLGIGPKGLENLCRMSCTYYLAKQNERITHLLEDIEANTNT